METTTLRQESLKQGNFYVPKFELKIEGVGLPRDVLRDVIQVTYKDSIKEIDSFEITVNNWDPTTRSFKYVGAETPESLRDTGPDGQRYRLFDPCNKEVELKMGYAPDLRVMIRYLLPSILYVFNSCKIFPDFRYIITPKTGRETSTEAKIRIQSVWKSASSISQSNKNASKFAQIIKVILSKILSIKNDKKYSCHLV